MKPARPGSLADGAKGAILVYFREVRETKACLHASYKLESDLEVAISVEVPFSRPVGWRAIK
jgi:hypothetical protein